MADPKPVQETAMWVAKTMDENHYNFHHYGTGALMKGKHLEGHLIVRNFQDGQWEPVGQIDAVTFKEQYGQRMDGCYACSVRCKKRAKIENERFHVETRFGGPEYETLGATGTNLAIDDLALLCELNQRLEGPHLAEALCDLLLRGCSSKSGSRCIRKCLHSVGRDRRIAKADLKVGE